MNLSSEQLKSLSEWQKESEKRGVADITMVQELLGLWRGAIARDDYELDGQFAFPPDSDKFDSNDIAEELGRARYEAIVGGQSPTDEDVRVWLQKKNDLAFSGDGGWYHFYLWRVDLPDGLLYFRSLHGDGGALAAFDGPYWDQKAALSDAGSLEINS